nr:immunoglobulin light chain junction region [Macaca mulatta]
GQHYYSTPLTF